MPTLPAQDLRRNVATWSVLHELVPGVVSRMLALMPAESYDPAFIGQLLETTYFDTTDFALRGARKRGDRYMTLRIRRYFPGNCCALSAKTESGKFRVVLQLADLAKDLIESGMYPAALQSILPPDLLARLSS